MTNIDILLASYNGGKFLAEQIDSILAQTWQDWRLIIQDDCSSDRTAEIARKYASEYPDKIVFYRRDTPSGSAKANFMDMLKYAEAPYIMFSDQDDVWLPEKTEKTFAVIRELEKTAGSGVPLLVHSDLLIVDSKLNTLHPSMFRYQGLNGKYRTLNRLLSQNNVTGCTTMVNQSLLQMAKEASAEKILMHDWWFALIAAAFGEIGFIDEPLIKYRQHEGNELGAVNNRTVKGTINAVKKQKELRGRVSVTFDQADAFYRCYKDNANDEAKKILEFYLSIPQKNKVRRIFSVLTRGYLKQNFMAAAGQIFFC